ncbi:phytoene desaturase family protein [Chloroflexota bacterium]
MKYDVIIIGSGLGGLSAGAKLAKEGKKVLLVEQQHHTGGLAANFQRKGYTIEVSLHEMGGYEDERFNNLLRDLNILDNLQLVRVPEFYRFVNGRVDIVVPDNREQAMKVLSEHFPEDKAGLKKYFDLIFSIREEIYRTPSKRWKKRILLPFYPILYPNLVSTQKKTLGDYLDSIIKNEDLKLVLQGNLMYYHDDPYTMSLLWFDFAQATYFMGASYIQGGSSELARHLTKVIEINGGEVLLNSVVTKIIVEDNTAIGVEYQRAKKEGSEIIRAFGEYIVANAAIPNVVNEMLPPEQAGKLKKRTANLEPSISILQVYLGFKKPPTELGNKCYSTIVFDKNVRTQRDMINNHKGDFQKRNFIFLDYSQIDTKLAPEGKGIGAITIIDYITDWENLDKEEYRMKKERVSNILIDRLDAFLPGIKAEIEYYEMGTSKTIRRYTSNPGGVIYGYAQTPGQSGSKRLPRKSPIKNLYFASAWTEPGGGFAGALASGYLCAIEILYGG